MKIISFAAKKGGVGKTTLLYNFARSMAASGKHILMIDSDPQASLSYLFGYVTTEDTLYDAFMGRDVTFRHVEKNLDLIPASLTMEDLEAGLSNKNNFNLIMMMWLNDHIQDIKDYDFILIDCHPDFMKITRNMIAVSHHVISPLIPDELGYQNKGTFVAQMDAFKDEVVDPISRKSYVDADVIFLPNKVKHNTDSSHEFMKSITADPDVDESLTIPDYEVFNKSTLQKRTVFDILAESKNKSDRDHLEKLTNVFNRIEERMGE